MGSTDTPQAAPTAAASRRTWERPAAAALLALVFGVAVWRLGYQSLSSDELDSLRFAQYDLGRLRGLLTQIGQNGPLHALLLHFWIRLAGTSEFAVRYLSVTFYLAAAALTYALGRRLGGASLGFAGAALLGFSPLGLWLAQEGRMYAQYVAFSAAAAYCLLRALETNRWRWWAGFIVTLSLALYSHVFAVFFFAFPPLYFVSDWRAHRARLPRFIVAYACLTLPYLPIAVWQFGAFAQAFSLSSGTAVSGRPDLMLLRLFSAFSAFEVAEPLAALGWTFVPLLGLGLLPLRGEGADRGRYLACYLGAPLLAYGLASLRVGIFGERYFADLLPPFSLLAASGLLWLWRRARPAAPAAALAVALVFGQSLLMHQFGPGQLRGDFRTVSRYLSSVVSPRDVLWDPHYTSPALLDPYYYRGYTDVDVVVGAPTFARPDFDGNIKAGTTTARRVWLLDFDYAPLGVSDYARPPLAWLEERAHRFAEEHRPPLHVWGYVLSPDLPASARPFASFGGDLALLKYSLDAPEPRAGMPLPVTLYWRAGSPQTADWWVSLRLTDAVGQVWGQADRPLLGGYYPPARWQVGETVADPQPLPVDWGTPPGEYTLTLKLYDHATGQEPPVHDPDGNPVGAVLSLTKVTQRPAARAPQPDELVPRHPSSLELGGLRLLGADLVGGPRWEGDTLRVYLWWQAERAPAAKPELGLQLVDAQGRVAAEAWGPLGPATHPPTDWQPGEVSQDRRALPFGVGLPAGTYRLRLLARQDGRALGWRAAPWPWEQSQADLGEVLVLR